ncbi:hypothetical protein GGS23DRAFT_618956 [Durotheca rogersii]|uniref:uncharacterized protein n=1 Tax=Durotheca rogersii TaxID=419775 RepID=UPI00221FBD93|nr:uncharacterized protein GGS23DRAFT_618956 [Durotheca rogersii]KAI5855115.1 hypothetical protein GGS23DRAFT_618956 [Durotheca rogersii]
MSSFSSILTFASLVAISQAHGVILSAQGLQGSPASVGFQVQPELARNCTAISPCQQDSTIIRDAEIAANIVNECGRTQLAGNIDIGENTENALAGGAVTQVKRGSQVKVTIHQVNADGAGPYTCDLVEAGNNGVITQNLTVENNVPGVNGFSQAKTEQFEILVTMPDEFTCTGSSAGNVCTMRCRNNAQAGPFGGCVPLQQIDTEPNVNTPENIPTVLSLDKVLAQVAQNNADLPAAIGAIKDAGADQALQNVAVVKSILKETITSLAAPVQTPSVITGVAASTTTTAAQATTTTARNGNNRGNSGNGNANTGNGNTNTGNGRGNGNNGNNNANAGNNNNANAGNNNANTGSRGNSVAENAPQRRRATTFVA